MFYLITWTVSNKTKTNYEVIEENDLAERINKLEKKEKNPKIELYEMHPTKYKITYENRVQKITEKKSVIEVEDKTGKKRKIGGTEQ